MNVMEAIKARHSVRAYKPKDVEEDKLKAILEAARLAPSAGNRQEWRFIIVKDRETRKKLCKAANNQHFVEEAPVVIACCAETDGHVMKCGQLSYPIDVAIAIDHMTLAAIEEGLGTCWIGAFSEDEAKQALNIPPHIRVIELLTLGYPDDKPRPKVRKRLEEIVRYEKWQ